MAGELEHDSGRFARISWLQPMLILRKAFKKIEEFVLELGGSSGGSEVTLSGRL